MARPVKNSSAIKIADKKTATPFEKECIETLKKININD